MVLLLHCASFRGWVLNFVVAAIAAIIVSTVALASTATASATSTTANLTVATPIFDRFFQSNPTNHFAPSCRRLFHRLSSSISTSTSTPNPTPSSTVNRNISVVALVRTFQQYYHRLEDDRKEFLLETIQSMDGNGKLLY